MLTKNEHADVIIIGGGPAGLMAAVAAAEKGARTLLLEKGEKLGRKLAISGGGRCNVTNAKPLPELMENIPGNAKFLYSTLHRFNNQHIMQFFQNLGIELKEEDRGRVFPVSNSALTVVAALVNEVRRLDVDIRLRTPVKQLYLREGKICGVILQSGETLRSPAVVIATGGCSVPATGSTGDAYPWAIEAGHTIVAPFPTEVPLVSNAPCIQNRSLQGLSLQNVELTLLHKRGKILTVQNGDMIFTHFGVSGPAALRCSHYVSVTKRKDPADSLILAINLAPVFSKEEGLANWVQRRQRSPRRHLHHVLTEMMPERLATAVLERAKVQGNRPMAEISNGELEKIEEIIHCFTLPIQGTLSLSKATVTGGGVSVKEIDPKTMASKLCNGLYFAGEVMDVHAHTGGYNITVAFSTGWTAGESAAYYATAT
ncbi:MULTISPECIES: NAD(P)/FAD-dependent oxidoreductase [Alicyclobacillus]|uniref:Rossmann fold flavoprotein n=1 Tax=Alicyclobacillus tolerans TaxID=90970 RepID=A0ABT9LTU5_9BACL|nr:MULTISPECIES: NAD(P)/FAD-dependent oxidoreductase [Alicyclobacillus]MDP9727685.1 putative Rossmann fold flavoprotein [Alicyclobacillus tengchongensis]